MRAAGYSTYPYKLATYVIGAALAGLAGFLFALKDGFFTPELLAWEQSGLVLLMVILGGMGSLGGAVLGTANGHAGFASGTVPVAGAVRRLRESLAPAAGPGDHRAGGLAARRVGGPAGPSSAAAAPKSLPLPIQGETHA